MNKVDPGVFLRRGALNFGPVDVERMTACDAIALVRSCIEMRQPLDIAICNAHTILTAIDDPEYAATLNRMTKLNDGIGISMASRFLHDESFHENLNGTDLVPKILADIGLPLRIYLLGAREQQVRRAKEHIESAYPNHRVVGYHHGYFDLNDCDDICDGINAAQADLLLVAMGNPRQENFIVQNRPRLNASVAMGVGALFDFMSGSVVRAPRLVQAAGLEWLFRLLQEPRRLFRRYVVGIPKFFWAVLKMKFGRLKSGVNQVSS